MLPSLDDFRAKQSLAMEKTPFGTMCHFPQLNWGQIFSARDEQQTRDLYLEVRDKIKR